MATDIRDWLKCCALCQWIKPGDRKAWYALMQEIVGVPMERCGVDLSGPWPLSREGNQYLCVPQDYFYKWIEVYAMPDKAALSVAKCLVKFMARYGQVEKLHSDQGQEFQANMSKHLFELWRVHEKYTTPYTPWSDGLVERANRTIQHLLKVYCEEHIDVWDEYIWCIMHAYNSTVQISTGCTPFILMHSRCQNPDLPLDILYTSRRPDLVKRNLICASKYLVEQQERTSAIHELVRRNLQASAKMQQRSQIKGGLKMRKYYVDHNFEIESSEV